MANNDVVGIIEPFYCGTLLVLLRCADLLVSKNVQYLLLLYEHLLNSSFILQSYTWCKDLWMALLCQFCLEVLHLIQIFSAINLIRKVHCNVAQDVRQCITA